MRRVVADVLEAAARLHDEVAHCLGARGSARKQRERDRARVTAADSARTSHGDEPQKDLGYVDEALRLVESVRFIHAVPPVDARVRLIWRPQLLRRTPWAQQHIARVPEADDCGHRQPPQHPRREDLCRPWGARGRRLSLLFLFGFLGACGRDGRQHRREDQEARAHGHRQPKVARGVIEVEVGRLLGCLPQVPPQRAVAALRALPRALLLLRHQLGHLRPRLRLRAASLHAAAAGAPRSPAPPPSTPVTPYLGPTPPPAGPAAGLLTRGFPGAPGWMI